MLFRRFTTLPAACLASSLTLAAAHAEDLDKVSATVSVGDLNLSQPSDDRILAQRLADAAKSVCQEANPDASPAMLQACADAAIEVALTEIQDRLDDQVDAKLDVIRTSFASP